MSPPLISSTTPATSVTMAEEIKTMAVRVMLTPLF
jgi:hypothetical protein